MGQLVDQVMVLTGEIRKLNDDAGALQAKRKEALTVLARRYGYAEAARMVGMSKVRVHQIVKG